MPYAYPLVATFLLTGGRETEVLGLEVEDVSFDRKAIAFRPNAWRRLKAGTSHRTGPLLPQLEEILRAYLYGGASPRVTGLLFPSVRTEKPSMITDVRKMLDAIGERAGWTAGENPDQGFPTHVPAPPGSRRSTAVRRCRFTRSGARWGTAATALVKRVYGHLGQVRHRSDVVEYRVDQQLAQLEAEGKAVEVDARRRTEAQHRRATATAYRDRLQGLRTVVSAVVPKH